MDYINEFEALFAAAFPAGLAAMPMSFSSTPLAEAANDANSEAA
jgi:hypothetical protein